MACSHEPIDLAAQLAAGNANVHVLRWLTQGFGGYLRAGGTVPLDRCLRLPTTPSQLRRVQRDAWLLQAAAEVGGVTSWARSCAMAAELDQFLSRGPWRAWQGLERPPEGSSRLRTALFFVATTNDGQPLTARHVHRIVGQTFIEKCQSPSFTIEASGEKR